jgi:hypothetical protein
MNGMTRPSGASPRVRLVQAPKDGSRLRGRYSDVPLSAVLKLSPHISDELAPEIKRRLDGAFTAALYLQNSAKKQTCPSKRALGALRQVAAKHRKLLESASILRELALSYEQELASEASNEGSDPKALARSLLRRDCEGVARLVRHATTVCRKWDNGPPTPMCVMSTGKIVPIEESPLTVGGHSKPHVGIIVHAIYNIWTNMLGLGEKPTITPKSPFVKFAYAVFRLSGEKIEPKYPTMEKRLTNKGYLQFHRDQPKFADRN